MPHPDDEASQAVEALSPGQVAALARALRDIADRIAAIERLLEVHLDADRSAVERRTLAWGAVASLAASRPGQLLALLLAAILAAAVAQLVGVDLDTLRHLVGGGVAP